ncbi:MAG: hypothetical protein QOH81_1097 [Sphingomonadales bacterium]|jgi:hypothetical protein|nr:hypothetical protein [Sphingomonadales bacterium]
MRLFFAAAGALLVLNGTALGAQRQTPPMPQGYDDPGPRPADPLPAIVARLRTTLRDPYSIRDMTLCEPERVNAYFGASAWRRAHWVMKLTLNAKNAFGAYTGAIQYDGEFDGGALTSLQEFRGIDLLTPEQNDRLMAFARNCPRVSDGEIQRLLQDH